jgi:membrane dipeptidase
MKRRDLIKGLVLIPVFGNASPANFLANSVGPKDLHKDAFVMDGHVHFMMRELLKGTDIGQRYTDAGTVDLPRAKQGGLDAMFFSVYTPENYYPGRHEIKNTFRVVELALNQIQNNSNMIEVALTAADITRINKKGKMAAFLDLEGGFDMDGDLNLLRALYRMGLRSVQLTAHNTTNAFIDACNDVSRWNGINDHGRAVIAEMNKLGMVINVAHASMPAIIQSAEASKHPVVYSHGGFQSIVNHPRCISDEAAKAVASKGGVIGIQFGSTFNNPKYYNWKYSQTPLVQRSSTGVAPKLDSSLTIEQVDKQVEGDVPMVSLERIPDEYWMGTDQLAKVIDFGVNLVGEDHVALGSDFDGGPELPREIKDISDYPQMTLALQKIGYSEKRIRKILGLNWLRVIREVTGS